MRIKYGVWFHGDEDDQPALCVRNRKPFVTEEYEHACKYMEEMLEYNGGATYSVCTIIVEDESTQITLDF